MDRDAMDRIARKLVTLWMVATTAHLPFPVCDGDDTGSLADPTASATTLADRFDIDFVLLGCDAPDDPDDGPVDDDPDSGTCTGGPFPVFMGSAASRARRHGKGAVDSVLPVSDLVKRCHRGSPQAPGLPVPRMHPCNRHPEAPLVMRC
ncbi:hypothetical protein [Maioricimonas sp. JC845]|uniref:hypothetical protein n=1 Tax=Maioricimonas sp. JC845 TaxID=3232138 RepID=UPI0034597920